MPVHTGQRLTLLHEAPDFIPPRARRAQPQDDFEASADSPAFSEPGFLAWPRSPSYSPTYRAPIFRVAGSTVRPGARACFCERGSRRLSWGWNTAFGENKTRATRPYSNNSFVSMRTSIFRARLRKLARVLQQEGDLVAAHALAKKGVQLFPESPGGSVGTWWLKSPTAQITTERVEWPCPRSR
jgi:hypothetical protein